MSQASSQDARAVCDYYLGSIDLQSACRYMAVSTTAASSSGKSIAELRTTCKNAEASCLAAVTQQSGETGSDCQALWFGPNCNATIAQVKTCTDDLAASLNRRYASVSDCDNADLASPITSDASTTLPPSCATAVSACPTLFSSPSENGEVTTDPPVTQACKARCAEFVAACGLEACPANCDVERLVYGDVCNPIGQRFYECAKGKAYDCSETDLMLAIDSCVAERNDYVYCYALDGIACEREAAYDSVCVDRDATRPIAKRCVSDAMPADCVRYSTTGYYCCAGE